ncbi:hypothetical protein ACFW9P_45475, partial [Streptomyces sp. NPDC059489]
MNAPERTPPIGVGDREVNLGAWLVNLRRRGVGAGRAWVYTVMGALGMRWGLPGEGYDLLAGLPELAVKVAVMRGEAVRDGLDPTDRAVSQAFSATVDALDDKLAGIQNGPYHGHDRRAALNLRAALAYYVHEGHVNAPDRMPPISVGDREVALGHWLSNLRLHGVVTDREWVIPVLDELGMRWGRWRVPAGEGVGAAPSGAEVGVSGDGVAGGRGGVADEQAAGLGVLAEGVAEAYRERDTAGSGSLDAAVEALDLPELADYVATKRAAAVEFPQDIAITSEFREAFTAVDQALVGIGKAYNSPAGEQVARIVRAALVYYIGYGDLDVPPGTIVALDGEEVNLHDCLQYLGESNDFNAHQYWVKPVLAAWSVRWQTAPASTGQGVGPVISVGHAVSSGGESSHVNWFEPAYGGDGSLDWLRGPDGPQETEPAMPIQGAELLGFSGLTWFDRVNQPYLVEEDMAEPAPVDQTGLETHLIDMPAYQPMDFDASDQNQRGDFIETANRDQPGEFAGLAASQEEYADDPGFWLNRLDEYLSGVDAEGDVFAEGDGLVQGPVAGRRGGSGRSRVADAGGGVSADLAESLGLLAEAVAGAYQQRDTDGGVLDAAVAALDGALAGIQNGPYPAHDRKAALNLRAALAYYVRAGHVNAPLRMPSMLVGDIEVTLGRWLRDLRGRGVAAGRVWVIPVLDALGMRWGVPGEDDGLLAGLPELAVKVAVMRGEAVRDGLDPTDRAVSQAFSAAVDALDDKLAGIQNGPYSHEDQRAALNLRAALAYYVRVGHVNAPQGMPSIRVGDEEMNLPIWVRDLRRGVVAAGRVWVRRVLDALGMRWGRRRVPGGEGMGAASPVGEVVVSGGGSGEVVPGLGDGGLGEAAVPESAGGLGTDVGAGSSGQHVSGVDAEGDVLAEGDGLVQGPVAGRRGGSGRSRVADAGGGVSADLAESLGVLAEGVAGAYQQRDTDGGVLDAAVAALDGALAGIQNGSYSLYDRGAALNLRAALAYYVREGRVNAPLGTALTPVGGIGVNLGQWGRDLRRRGVAAGRVWVIPVLDALGMRWGVPGEGDGLLAGLPELAVKVAVMRGEAVRDGLDPTDRAVSQAFSAAVDALDDKLAGIQNGPYGGHDRRAALNLRAALAYYVRVGHVNAPQGMPSIRVGDEEMYLGRWVGDLRRGVAAGRVWVIPVLDALGMDWSRLREPGGDDPGPASSLRLAPARSVRNPQPSDHDLKHPEWDLTDGEWNLIKNPLEEIVRKYARNSFNALMFRFRNGIGLKGEVPRDRYGTPSAGQSAFYRWARTDSLLKALERVEGNPGVVHPVVERTLRAAFDAAQDYMNRRELASMYSVTTANAHSSTQGNAGNDLLRQERLTGPGEARAADAEEPAEAMDWQRDGATEVGGPAGVRRPMPDLAGDAAGWEWSVGEARAWVGGVRVETERVEPSGAVV